MNAKNPRIATLRDFIVASYRPTLEFHFRHHPRKEEIIEELFSETITAQRIDDIFEENEVAIAEWLDSDHAQKAGKNGYVIFEIRGQ